MNNKLTTFVNDYLNCQVRTLELDGEAWLVGKDVCDVLGYGNSRDALCKHVDEEDKGVAKCDTLGGAQNLTIINESGLYSLVFGSKVPAAKMFKRWVTSEVLPAIRQTGCYQRPMTQAEILAGQAGREPPQGPGEGLGRWRRHGDRRGGGHRPLQACLPPHPQLCPA